MKVEFRVCCTGVYTSSLDVPDDISDDEIQAYIEEHLPDCNMEDDIEFVEDSDIEPLCGAIEKDDGTIIEVKYN